MKILRNIFTNPFAIATALVHWLVFIYCLIFEDTLIFSKFKSVHLSNEIYQWLINLNCLPLSMVETIGTILEKTVGMNLTLNIILTGFALFIVNFQWMFVGFCFSKLFKLEAKSLV
ncbi:MAG: hypothetical protein ACR2IA_11285 [Pyrinomonadaceae bacterium]